MYRQCLHFRLESFFLLFTIFLLADKISEQIVTGFHGDNNVSSKFFSKMTAFAHPWCFRGGKHRDDPKFLPGVMWKCLLQV